MATLIKTNGEIVGDVKPKTRTFDYKELQGFVDGYIEILPLIGNMRMVVNEDGKLNGLKKNDVATLIWELFNKTNNAEIVGDVLLVKNEELQ